MALRNSWGNASPLSGEQFVCPFCGVTNTPLMVSVAGSTMSVEPRAQVPSTRILACVACSLPFIDVRGEGKTIPSVRLGRSVKNVPAGLEQLYNEASVVSHK